MFSHTDCAAAAARDHVVDGQPGRLVAAVLAGVGVAREHRLAGDLAPVDVARDAHVADQPDHARPVELEPLGVQRALAVLEQLGARLEHQDGRAPHRADVDRLVAGVEDQDPRRASAGALPLPDDRRAPPPPPRAAATRRRPTSGSARSSMVRGIVEPAGAAVRQPPGMPRPPTRVAAEHAHVLGLRRAAPRSPRRRARRRRDPSRSTKNM